MTLLGTRIDEEWEHEFNKFRRAILEERQQELFSWGINPFERFVPEEQHMAEKVEPIHKVKCGGVTATVWENKSKDGNTYETVNLERNYKDQEGEWKKTSSMRLNDLPKAALAASEAYKYLVTRPKED